MISGENRKGFSVYFLSERRQNELSLKMRFSPQTGSQYFRAAIFIGPLTQSCLCFHCGKEYCEPLRLGWQDFIYGRRFRFFPNPADRIGKDLRLHFWCSRTEGAAYDFNTLGRLCVLVPASKSAPGVDAFGIADPVVTAIPKALAIGIIVLANLENSNHSMAAISRLVGFNSGNHFKKVFSNIVGRTP